jgi:transposase
LPADYKKEFPWLKEVDSLALANAQMNLNTAYSNFFRDPSVGFPKFKSKHRDKKSYTTNNQSGTIRLIDAKTIRLPKLKNVRIKLHRQIPGDAVIKSATISQTATGKHYISILVEFEASIEQVTPTVQSTVGLDYSSKSLYEDLNMRNMAQGLRLAKSTNDNGFGMLKTFLAYKLAEQGKQLIAIDKWHPSSKSCSCCGHKNKELSLNDRIWTCRECGKVLDRDINAAINIKNEGCRILGIA